MTAEVQRGSVDSNRIPNRERTVIAELYHLDSQTRWQRIHFQVVMGAGLAIITGLIEVLLGRYRRFEVVARSCPAGVDKVLPLDLKMLIGMRMSTDEELRLPHKHKRTDEIHLDMSIVACFLAI